MRLISHLLDCSTLIKPSSWQYSLSYSFLGGKQQVLDQTPGVSLIFPKIAERDVRWLWQYQGTNRNSSFVDIHMYPNSRHIEPISTKLKSDYYSNKVSMFSIDSLILLDIFMFTIVSFANNQSFIFSFPIIINFICFLCLFDWLGSSEQC